MDDGRIGGRAGEGNRLPDTNHTTHGIQQLVCVLGGSGHLTCTGYVQSGTHTTQINWLVTDKFVQLGTATMYN